MTHEPQDLSIASPKRPRVALVILAMLVGAGAYLFASKSSVVVTTRTESADGVPMLMIDVLASDRAERFDIPQFSLTTPITDGRGSLKVPLRELPPGENALAYVVREPWYLPNQSGVIHFERMKREVNYLVRVEPGPAGGAWVSIGGDPGNHLLLFDPSGKVAFSGRHADHADARGVVRVRFSDDDMSAAQDPSGAVTAKISVTSPTGEVSDHEIVLMKAPIETVNASVLFPPPQTVIDRAIVRVRILTEPDTTVRFGNDPRRHEGPRVEYDWSIPGQGKQTLAYEVRAAGLHPVRGTIAVERRPPETDSGAETDRPALRITYNELAVRAEALSGETLELAGTIIAPPAASGAMELIEIGSGDEARKGEVAVVYSRSDYPPIQSGDRLIVSGTLEGTQRLRTAAGRVRAVPRLRATEILIRSQAESAAAFESRFADLAEIFWKAPEEPQAGSAGSPPTRLYASYAPWPDTPPAQAREAVQKIEIVSGLAHKLLIPAWEPPGPQVPPEQTGNPPIDAPPPIAADDAPGEEYAPETIVERTDPVGESPQAPVETAKSKPGRVDEVVVPEEEAETQIAPQEGDEATAATELGRADEIAVPAEIGAKTTAVPEAATPPPAVLGQTAWDRDRALEAELLGRGISGVQIYRKGRSIRLRGAVGNDFQLRTLYQLMNNKGYGEVDYGVEVR